MIEQILEKAEDPEAHSRGQVYRLDEANRVAELVVNADGNRQ